MTREPPRFCCNPQDPAFVEKARVYVFDLYRFKRNERLEPPPPPEGAVARHRPPLEIDGSKLPEEYMPRRQFLGLKDIYDMNEAFIATAMTDEVDSADEAALRIAYSAIAEIVNHFIFSLLAFLGLDRCISPQNPWPDASIMIGWGEGAMQQSYETLTRDAATLAGLCRVACPTAWQNAEIQEALAVLRETGQLFFMTIGAIFPVRSIAKCQIAFVRLMDALGTVAMAEAVDNYVRRRKTMQRDIEAWRRHGGAATDAPAAATLTQQDIRLAVAQEVRLAVAQEVADVKAGLAQNTAATQANTEATQANTRAVANMDRHQKTIWKKILKLIEGFIALVKTPREKLSAEKVQDALVPPERYACLEGIPVSHRAQVRAVIDYTWQHPIVLKEMHKDDFSLAKAVKVVWAKNAEKEKWEDIPGSFRTERDLHGACYNLRGKSNDPFKYQT